MGKQSTTPTTLTGAGLRCLGARSQLCLKQTPFLIGRVSVCRLVGADSSSVAGPRPGRHLGGVLGGLVI